MGLSILMLVIGLVLLVKGGDWLVSGASSVARKYGISELVIGLTVVAFGTSAPELVVSVLAAVNQHPEIALGNVIGSNNFNLFVILGITGIIAPLSVQVSTIRKEIPISLGAAVLLLLLANEFFINGQVLSLGRWDAFVFLVCFVLFLFYVFKSMKLSDVAVDAEGVAMKTGMAVLAILGGLAALIIGGRWVVNSAVDLARMFHVSEKVIGLTIVAMGTSLPELVTSLVAIRKKSADMAIGNVIGSNIFNIFLILGTSAMIRPMMYSTAFNHDLLLLLAGTVLLLVAMFTGGKRRLDRWEAFILLAVYVAYLVYVAMRN